MLSLSSDSLSSSWTLHFSSSHRKDRNYYLFTPGCQTLFLLSFFFFSISLSFTTGNPGQFQGSYGKFLRCDKDFLGFCSVDFYETVDGCKIRAGTVQRAAWQPGLCRKMGGAGARAGWCREGMQFDLVPGSIQARRRGLALARIPCELKEGTLFRGVCRVEGSSTARQGPETQQH